MTLINAATAAPFLPATLGAWAAIIGALAAAAAALLGVRNRRHLQEVHVLVNSQLEDVKRESRQQRLVILIAFGVSAIALAQITRLTGQRDTARRRT